MSSSVQMLLSGEGDEGSLVGAEYDPKEKAAVRGES
jgi:hypothetical protein